MLLLWRWKTKQEFLLILQYQLRKDLKIHRQQAERCRPSCVRNNGQSLLVLQFWSATGMCYICKGADKGVWCVCLWCVGGVCVSSCDFYSIYFVTL